ncbi:type I polyketide synthase [Streptomyces sp. NPDC088387]|uniref:type I polyketide synthase n=1 Tax=Streptomyces sp. NPDC088387 TaxID=3365859 RepID=UPI00382DE502
MSDQPQLVDYLKRLTAELRATKDHVAQLEQREVERRAPVAVVGIGCRYPGADSPQALWRLVAEGRDATGPVPEDRQWPPVPDGDGGPARGGFLPDAAGFDAAFFGISPREATAMDPQQRLLLEVAWEALEDAGIDPHTLRDSGTAVFAGANQQDYGPPLHASPSRVAGHRLTGMAGSVVSGRLSYVLGLHGPALTVDTACSSSLVAVHLACRALRSGETGLALAAGVTVMSTPGTVAEFGRQGGLAADGRCKAFGAAADGTGLAEGAGVLVLERLADARRNGHRVLALIKGSAVNQDGASNGLSAPSGPAQQAVIRAALADAGLGAADVDAVEAHGTGTALGDPIEAQAILAAYGGSRPAGTPLWLGSLKSNIGHTQAAAGVGGIIKMVGALVHEELPRTLHADEPTPHVDWSAGPVRLLHASRPWRRADGRPRRVGVSSFGISGTNAHVVVEEAPKDTTSAPDEAAHDQDGPALLVLSGHSEQALRAQAARIGAHLTAHPSPVRHVAHTLAGRAALEHRAAAVVRDTAEACAVLASIASGTAHARLTGAQVHGRRGRLAFLLGGEDGLRAAIGGTEELRTGHPVFRRALDEVCALADPLLGTSLGELLRTGEGTLAAGGTVRIEDAPAAQPALFAVQVAQFRLLHSWGIAPDLLVADGAGEVAAAHVSGALSLPDAVRLAVARARLAQRLGGADAVTVVSSRRDGQADSPHGELPEDSGAHNRPLPGAGPLDSALSEFRAVVAGLNPHIARLPVVSTLTGRAGDTLADPDHWVNHVVRGPGDPRAAVRAAVEVHGAGALVELGTGSDPVARAHAPREAVVLSMAGNDPGSDRRTTGAEKALNVVGRLYVHGFGSDLPAVVPGQHVGLPSYAWQHERYWLLPATPADDVPAVPTSPRSPTARLGHHTHEATADGAVGGHLPAPANSAHTSTARPASGAGAAQPALTERFGGGAHGWVRDHVVGGRVLLPATAFLELALRAGYRAGHPRLGELVLHTPLDLTGGVPTDVRVTTAPSTAGGLDLTVTSRPASGGPWTTHASGHLVPRPDPAAEPPVPHRARAPKEAVPRPLEEHYARCTRLGLSYGPALRTLAEVRHTDGTLYSRSASAPPYGDATGELFAPAALDAVLQALLTEPGALLEGRLRLPFSWASVTVHRTAQGPLSARITRLSADSYAAEVEDADGRPVLSVGTLTMRPLPAPADPPAEPNLYRRTWAALGPAAQRPTTAPWLLGTPAEGLSGFARAHPDLPTLMAAADRADRIPEALVIALQPAAEASGGVAGAVHTAVVEQLALLRRCLAGPTLVGTTPVLLTRDHSGESELVAAAVRGLWRSAAREHPGRLGLLHVRGHGGSAEAVAEAAARLAGGADGIELTLIDGIVHGPVHTQSAEAASPGPAFDPDGTVLVTGGGGALAAELVPHLVTVHGIRHIVVASRSGRLPHGVDGLDADIRAVACDVADPDAVRALVATAGERRPLRAVVHAAGVLDDSTVARMSPEQVHRVLRPKVDGAWHLHEATIDLPLTRFVLFGSASALLGTAGQANYAAANGFLDALAVHRAGLGLPGLSIGWGWWEDTGMTQGLPLDARQRLHGLGLRPMAPQGALALFDRAVEEDSPVVLAGRFDDSAFSPAPARREAGIDAGARTSAREETRSPACGESASPAAVALARPRTGEAWITLVRAVAADVLGHPSPDRLPPDADLVLAGLDSLGSLELRDRLSELCGRPLPLAVIYEHPSPSALGTYLHGLPPDEDSAGDSADRSAEESR